MQPPTPKCLESVSTSKPITDRVIAKVDVNDISAETFFKSLDLTEEDAKEVVKMEQSDVLLIEQNVVYLNFEETVSTSTGNISAIRKEEIYQNHKIKVIQSEKPSVTQENIIPLPIIITVGSWIGKQLWDLIKGLFTNYIYDKYKRKNDVFVNVKIAQFDRNSSNFKMVEYNGKIEDINYVYEKIKETFIDE
ncbi:MULTISPECIES: hypothetical protein [unclassified Dehalobacter]|uniref:hypothetical protein n=1 Tax=unclassified Dehalobacter TaxID=2635733 RepID=UPI000E6C6ECA|nr:MULTISPECIES: hypothetical protein [unclassified Dehalobacter]RJE48915.1 hypothetical protein A7K50_09235 [Dehalobacter sp. MCB1]TCX52079.1 hypothetical protein C1I36_07120 [Dehalobacter sp. 14DCB1]TCX53152.1 hypothetical protein C1I38_08885 [Dehalobacter sp. 12DCB1]